MYTLVLFFIGELTLIFILLWKLLTFIKTENTVSFIFGGDVTFSGPVRHFVRKGKCAYNESFRKIRPLLQSADFVVVNFEMVVQENDTDTKFPSKSLHYLADKESIEVLQYAGINTVALANNHITDLGRKGIKTTKTTLEKNRIKYFGLTYGDNLDALQKPLILVKNGILIGVLGYCRLADCFNAHSKLGAGAAAWSVPKAVVAIKGLRRAGCHIVILYMHWDNSYTSAMSSKYIRDINKIEKLAPVEVIVGAHPHTTHPHFYNKKTLIATSLGNFLFPSHYASMSPFYGEVDDLEAEMSEYEDIWYEQSVSYVGPTSHGKLLRVEFNKHGVIRNSTQFINVRILPDFDSHCLTVQKEKNTDWKTVCGEEDTECVGTDYCNILQCDDIDPNPGLT